MIVLSEASAPLPPSRSALDVSAATEAAKLVGCRVYYLQPSFDPSLSLAANAARALAAVPMQPVESPAVWVGFIPSIEWYSAMYAEAERKRIRLLNTPDEHRTAMELDRAYSRIWDLTPESVALTDPRQAEDAVERLGGLPLFVKGAVKSRKELGYSACVATSIPELRRLVNDVLTVDVRSRGKAIVRKLVPIRHVHVSPTGFPVGREFRVFRYREALLDHGYYWEADEPQSTLTGPEERAVLALASEAALRLAVPFVAIDIAQLVDYSWTVVEASDAQFAAPCQIPLLRLWNRIRAIAPGRA
jgi:hypothetical protein